MLDLKCHLDNEEDYVGIVTELWIHWEGRRLTVCQCSSSFHTFPLQFMEVLLQYVVVLSILCWGSYR
jgi:hypothetical protein